MAESRTFKVSAWASDRKTSAIIDGPIDQNRIEIPEPWSGRFWTATEVAELKVLRESGKRDGEIARLLGRTYNSIRAKRWKLELCARSPALGNHD